jgi:hypothetical protein
MPIRLNLLAEAQAVEDMRRRDPVKRVIWISGLLLALILVWASSLLLRAMIAKNGLNRVEAVMLSKAAGYKQVTENQKLMADAQAKLLALQALSTNRLLNGNLLDALQHATVEQIQLVHLKVDQTYAMVEAVKARTNGSKVVPGTPGTVTEKSHPHPGRHRHLAQSGRPGSQVQGNPRGQRLLLRPAECEQPDQLEEPFRPDNFPGNRPGLRQLHPRMSLSGENSMSLNKMTKAKRIQVVVVTLGALLVLAASGYGLIKLQYDKLADLARKKSEADVKLEVMETAAKNASQIEAALAEVASALAEKEATMATGDLYSWSINTMKSFKTGYKVEIPQFGPISPQSASTLLPSFPYKQATLNVGGKAYYHELGRFIADFENQYPFMRVVNLTLDPDPGAAPGDRDRLLFKMDIITLVKPGNS